MKNFGFKFWKKALGIRFLIIGVLVVLITLILTSQAVAKRVYNIHVLGQDLSFYSLSEVESWLSGRQELLDKEGFIFRYDEVEFAFTMQDIGANFDLEATMQAVIEGGQELSFWDRLNVLAHPMEVRPVVSFDKELLAQKVQEVADELNRDFTNASLRLNEQGEFVVVDELVGLKVLQPEMRAMVEEALFELRPIDSDVKLDILQADIVSSDVEGVMGQLDGWLAQPLYFNYEGHKWEVGVQELKNWVGVRRNSSKNVILTWQTKAASDGLWQRAEQGLNQHPRDAIFEVQNGKVTRFEMSANGYLLNTEATLLAADIVVSQILDGQKEGSREVSMVVEESFPGVSTQQSNDLGIKEMIAQGVSYYRGSSWARAYNLSNASNLVTGALIAPGQEFSFNSYVGGVTEAEGFVEGLIISGGRTVPGVGGGVCQASTTAFRVAVNAGLPIVERNPHSYRVGYYEGAGPGYEHGKPGFDAAIYSPYKDLRFLNDTGNHLLLVTYNDKSQQKLVYTLYGTNDGRKVDVSEPTITSTIPAPPPEYIDRPDKPVGWIKQVDWAANGATTVFTRTVTYPSGEVKKEDFWTTYRAWSAKYERGMAQ